MIFSTFDEFKKNYKKKKFSQVYYIKNNPKLETIDKLIELVATNKDSFVFESVEKVKIRGRYTMFNYRLFPYRILYHFTLKLLLFFI